MRAVIQCFSHALAPAAARFYQALAHPEVAQLQVQQQLCDRIATSKYGQFWGVNSLADWQRLPIVDYPDLWPWISGSQPDQPGTKAAAARPPQPPHRSLLTPEPVRFYEQTSGSRGQPKWIPYTASLRRSFNHLFCVWANDLIRHGPPFTTGKIYFCISPQFGNARSSALNDDSAYLDGWLRCLLWPFLVAPSGPNQYRNADEFKTQLACALLKTADLETLSIWSPTFLTVLLRFIQQQQHQLAAQLRRQLSRQRSRLLLAPEISWSELWPELKLISCWDSVYSATSAATLRSQFPRVLVQGKGLLATEAPLTVPLIPAQGCVPLLDQVFLEFMSDTGEIHALHQLTAGQEYCLILSQTGGLYRYRLGDRVRVLSPYLNTPRLEFLGREGIVSDLVGEKLDIAFVQATLAQLPLSISTFQMLVPVLQPQAGYVLLLDQLGDSSDAVARQLDVLLNQSPQYHRARQLGQLSSPQVLVAAAIPQRMILHQLQQGQKWGDLKQDCLWTEIMSPQLRQDLEALAEQSG